MPCAQCGFMLAPLVTTCPRCGHIAGNPVPPYVPPQPTHAPPNPQNAPLPATAAKAGFFGFLGAWAAALGLSCLVPLVGCALLLFVGGILCLVALVAAHH